MLTRKAEVRSLRPWQESEFYSKRGRSPWEANNLFAKRSQWLLCGEQTEETRMSKGGDKEGKYTGNQVRNDGGLD